MYRLWSFVIVVAFAALGLAFLKSSLRLMVGHSAAAPIVLLIYIVLLVILLAAPSIAGRTSPRLPAKPSVRLRGRLIEPQSLPQYSIEPKHDTPAPSSDDLGLFSGGPRNG